MKHTRSLLLVGLAAPAVLALARPSDEVAFAPAEGLRLTKSFNLNVTSTIDDMEMIVNGSEQEAPPMEVETVQSFAITVTDHYVKTEGGRATKLERTFDGLSGEMEIAMQHPFMGNMDTEATSESDLEGLTVVFSWNEEDEAYDIAFSEDDADEDEELLEGLDADMDLRGFLPTGPVSVDDSWSFDPNVLTGILAPGGDLSLLPQDLPAEMDMGSGLDYSKFLGEVEGDCTAVYEGQKRVDERTIAVIAVTMEVSSNNDITEFMAEAAEKSAGASGMDIEQDVQSADITLEFELEGELLWDVESRHIYSLTLSGTTESVMDIAANIAAMGQEMEVEQAMYSSGEIEVSVSLTSE